MLITSEGDEAGRRWVRAMLITIRFPEIVFRWRG
jgi:hypothetical protein